MNNLRLGTRKSPLALWQAEHVRDRLQRLHPGLKVELVTMTTEGDRLLDTSLAKVGGKGTVHQRNWNRDCSRAVLTSRYIP